MKRQITLILASFIVLSSLTFGQNREVILEESFDEDLGVFTEYSVIDDDLTWHWEDFGEPAGCALMEGYDGEQNVENEDWLISPELDFTDKEQVRLNYMEAINYEDDVDGNNKVMVSTNYTGSGDPNDADWEEMEVTNRAEGNSWEFVTPDPVDLSAYDGMSDVYIAFRYTSSTENAGTWEVDNILVDEAIEEEINVTAPNGFEHWMRGESYDITWTSNNLDNNVKIELTGTESMVIAESVENTGSYAWEVPSDLTTGGGYKIQLSDATDGEPVDASDSAFYVIEAIYFEGFEDDLGEWMPYSVTGDET